MPESTEGRDEVLLERDGNVLIVTLNRPKARNAVNLAVFLGVGEALEQAEQDPDIRVVIITGAGEEAFCAGADLKAVGRGEKLQPDDPAKQSWGFAGIVTHPISKPIIAAVNGFALGGGTEIALSCDLIVAADTATFGLPEVKRGVIAGAGGAFRLVQQLPRKIAMEALLTGDPIPAQKALDWGLVNAVVPLSQLREAAMALAARLTVNAPLAVQASKRIANHIVGGRMDREQADWALSLDEAKLVLQSEDLKEGIAAFTERRAPQWKGR